MSASVPVPGVALQVNGETHHIDVDPATPLLIALRNYLGLTAAKFGCGLEQCHACAVLADGEVVTSCATAVEAFVGKEITTLEGLPHGAVRDAFLEEQAAQCGYCIPAIVLSVHGLLARSPKPSQREIVEALDPHLCRCGSHPRILRAVRRVAAS